MLEKKDVKLWERMPHLLAWKLFLFNVLGIYLDAIHFVLFICVNVWQNNCEIWIGKKMMLEEVVDFGILVQKNTLLAASKICACKRNLHNIIISLLIYRYLK
jgi:hypothetical protein